MRKASQDGGDSTSITSGIENETKKPGAGILKSTRNSIKRKVQHFSDDTANEPLLVKNKERSEIEKQSAKLLLSKTKTDFACEKGDDKDKLLADSKIAKPSISDVTGITHGVSIGNDLKEHKISNSQSVSTAAIHNHMNTNVFGPLEGLKNPVVAKTQILVELDVSKQPSYSPSPLIFTTAKIHTDGKMQQMEPVQVTPVPILSTIEGGAVKTETKSKETSEKSNRSSDIFEITDKNDTNEQLTENRDIILTPFTTQVVSLFKLPEKHEVNVTSNQHCTGSSSDKLAQSVSTLAGELKHIGSDMGKNTTEQLQNINKKTKDEILSTKIPQLSPGNKDATGSKLSSNAIKANKTDSANKISNNASTIVKSYVDINKNVQSQSVSDSVTKTENNRVVLKSVAAKPIKNISGIKEIDAGSSIKDDLAKTNRTSISTTKVGKDDKNMTNTTKLPIKEQAHKDLKSLNSEISANKTTAMGNTKNSVSKTIESNLSKTASPSTLMSSTNKSNTLDKSPVALSSKMISKESGPLVQPLPKIPAISESVPNIVKSAYSTTPLLTNTTSKTPQTTSNCSSALSKMKSTTDSSKIPSSGPTTNLTKTSTTEVKFTSTEIASSSLELAKTQITTVTTASKSITTENLVIKTSAPVTLNNVAMVVSSISKPTTTESGVKIPSLSSSSTGSAKSKQSPSAKMAPSGIPTVSSTVKTSTVNTVPPDKTSSGVTSSPVNKSISSIRNNTKSVSSTTKLATTDSSSLASSVCSSTVKPLSTTAPKNSAKINSQSESKPSESVKDIKVSKA